MQIATKVFLTTLLASTFTCASADVVQVWECTLHGGKTEADVMKASSAWLAAARSMKGGAELKIYHEFPLAADPGVGGFNFVLTAADPATWGTFFNSYDSSAAAKADEDWNNVASCGGSTLWSSSEVK
jgi:hypothetical protein